MNYKFYDEGVSTMRREFDYEQTFPQTASADGFLNSFKEKAFVPS